MEKLSHLMDGNNKTCLPDGRKELERLKMRTKIPCQSVEGAFNVI